MNQLDKFQIVLVEPQSSENIGSVCRAMKTMDIHRLVIVSSKEYDLERIKALSVHAFDLYENHRRFSHLKEALSDSVLSVGATRRKGKNRKYFFLTPQQLIQKTNTISKGPISIVFGRESDGLTEEELHLCNLGLTIETSSSFPSLNLAQAVQIVTYTLYTSTTPVLGFQPISASQVNKLATHAAQALEEIHYYNQKDRLETERFFTDLLARSSLSEKESKRLEKMITKVMRLQAQGE
ncbi:MAG: RNA methyltransferase [Sphaerochaetaceae bacterium]|jgi:tRNA/rRNA methyltransferase